MFKITRAASKILKSTSNIKIFTLSSIKAINQYLNPSKSERFEDASHEFIVKKKLSEFVDFKATNSFSDLQVVIPKEGAIDWVFVRLVSWFNMVILFSGASLVAKYVKDNSKQDMVAEYSVCSFLFSAITLLLVKTLYLGVFLTNIVMFILTPISIFLFLILIKHLYLGTKN